MRVAPAQRSGAVCATYLLILCSWACGDESSPKAGYSQLSSSPPARPQQVTTEKQSAVVVPSQGGKPLSAQPTQEPSSRSCSSSFFNAPCDPCAEVGCGSNAQCLQNCHQCLDSGGDWDADQGCITTPTNIISVEQQPSTTTPLPTTPNILPITPVHQANETTSDASTPPATASTCTHADCMGGTGWSFGTRDCPTGNQDRLGWTDTSTTVGCCRKIEPETCDTLPNSTQITPTLPNNNRSCAVAGQSGCTAGAQIPCCETPTGHRLCNSILGLWTYECF